MLDGIHSSNDTKVTEIALVEKARAMAPILEERASKAEKERRISTETDREFREAGFYAALQPRRYGGLELDYGAQTQFAIELSRVCASSGWVAGILACHGWIAGMFPDEAQSEIWGRDPTAKIATSFLPINAKVEGSEAGLRVSGRWRFSSGVDHCGWAILLAMAQGDGDLPPNPVFVIVNLQSCLVEDTWHSTGLAATGSNDIVVDDLKVPPHRVMPIVNLRGEDTPGYLASGNYLYKLPLFAVFPFNIIGPAIGAAHGALDRIVSELSKRQTVTGTDLSRVATVHQRIGKATALLDAAYALLGRIRSDIITKGHDGLEFEMTHRARYRLGLGHIAQNCCQAVDELLPLTGGRGLETSHPVQRAWRDVHAVAQHIGLVWDLQTTLFGNILMGHGSPDPKL